MDVDATLDATLDVALDVALDVTLDVALDVAPDVKPFVVSLSDVVSGATEFAEDEACTGSAIDSRGCDCAKVTTPCDASTKNIVVMTAQSSGRTHAPSDL